MIDSGTDFSATSPSGDARWMHALRNEIGTMMIATSATSHLLSQGRTEQALENLQRIEDACRRCRALLP